MPFPTSRSSNTAMAASKRMRTIKRPMEDTEVFSGEAKGTATDLATAAAEALDVTDKAMRKRVRKKRQIEINERKAAVKFKRDYEDAIQNLVHDSTDPEIYGIPFVFLQAPHLILLAICVGVAVLGGSDQFAAFNFKGPSLECLRQCVKLVFGFNIFLAVMMVVDELVGTNEQGKPKGTNWTAFGWFLKGVFLGGLVTWQRKERHRASEEQRKIAHARERKKADYTVAATRN